MSTCDVAVPYGKSDVNETYTLMLYDANKKEINFSSAGRICNPDFGKGKIVSTYRDAARWHKETLCYSTSMRDFYPCEKIVTIDKTIKN